MGRVNTRALRLERHARRLTHNGRQADVGALPPLVTSPAILVAWDYLPTAAAWRALCGFADGRAARVFVRIRSTGTPSRRRSSP